MDASGGMWTPEYMIREEVQRDKIKSRMGKRVWSYERRLEEGRGEILAVMFGEN